MIKVTEVILKHLKTDDTSFICSTDIILEGEFRVTGIAVYRRNDKRWNGLPIEELPLEGVTMKMPRRKVFQSKRREADCRVEEVVSGAGQAEAAEVESSGAGTDGGDKTAVDNTDKLSAKNDLKAATHGVSACYPITQRLHQEIMLAIMQEVKKKLCLQKKK